METTYTGPHDFDQRNGQVHYYHHPTHNVMTPYQLQHGAPINKSQWGEPIEQPKLSLFALTILEQDRAFYRQFPEAKQGATGQWGYQFIPREPYLDNFENRGEVSTPLTAAPQNYSVPPDTYFLLPSPIETHPEIPPVSFNHLYHDYIPVAEQSTSILSAQLHAHHDSEWPVQHSRIETNYNAQHVADSSRAPSPPLTAPPSPVLKVETHQLVPSQHRHLERSYSQPAATPVQPRHRARPRSMGYIPTSPASPNDFVSPRLSATSSRATSPLNGLSTFINNDPIQLTGHWSADAQAASEHLLHAPAPRRAQIPEIIAMDRPVVDTPIPRRHHLTYRLRKAIRAQSHPYTNGKSKSRSPSRMGSPGPRKGRPRVPKPKTDPRAPGKPTLACLFCRGRKIACGAPLEGNKDNTCDQCTKRSLKCKYPTESHRGIRKNKRKKEVDLELNAEIMAAAGLNESYDADADAEGEDEF